MMKKLLYFSLFTILTLSILLNYMNVTESIKLSFNICINNLFPSIIPFMLLSNILINYNFTESLNEMFGKTINKIFKVNQSTSFALILSIFTGTPSNGKYLKDLYDNNMINESDITKCLNFCHFTNPIFILSTIGYSFLNNKKLGLIILISHYLGSIIIGIIMRNGNIEIINEKKQIKNKRGFIKILNSSITSTTSNLILILGIISTCLVITTILNSVLNLNYNYKFLYGIIEITQGLKYLSLSTLDIKIKTIISTFLISFGGFSIHMQVFSIIDNKKIKYKPYLLSRVFHCIISSIICLILINIYKI